MKAHVDNGEWDGFESVFVDGCDPIFVRSIIRDHVQQLRDSFKTRFQKWTRFPLKIVGIAGKDPESAQAIAKNFLCMPA